MFCVAFEYLGDEFSDWTRESSILNSKLATTKAAEPLRVWLLFCGSGGRGTLARRRWLDDTLAFAFLEDNHLVCLHIQEGLLLVARPGYLDSIHLHRVAYTKMKPQIILRNITPSGSHLVDLLAILRNHSDPGADAALIRLSSVQLEDDPVLSLA